MTEEMNKNDAGILIEEVIGNLRNLEEILAYLENKEDGSLYALMKSNIQSDLEKLEKAGQALK